MSLSRKSTLVAGLGAIALLGLAAHSASAGTNLVVDGDFNINPGASQFQTFGANSTFGGTNNAAWTVDYGSVDEINGYFNSPPGGGNSVDLSGNEPGEISQTVSGLTVGDTYDLSFELAGNPDGSPNPKTVDVSIGGISYGPASFDTSGQGDQSLAYIPVSYAYTATSTSALLTFGTPELPTSNDTAYGGVIGNVNFSAAPEPSQIGMLALMGLGLGGLMLRARKAKATLTA